MSWCHWLWGLLQGLDLNMLGQCLLEEDMVGETTWRWLQNHWLEAWYQNWSAKREINQRRNPFVALSYLVFSIYISSYIAFLPTPVCCVCHHSIPNNNNNNNRYIIIFQVKHVTIFLSHKQLNMIVLKITFSYINFKVIIKESQYLSMHKIKKTTHTTEITCDMYKLKWKAKKIKRTMSNMILCSL